MPHTFLQNAKSQLPAYAIAVLAAAKAFLISKVFEIVNEILDRIKKQCPPQSEVKRLLKRIDSIEGLLQGVEKKIKKIEKLPPLLDGAILVAKIYLDYQYHLNPKLKPIPINPPVGAYQGTNSEKETNNRIKRIRNTEEVLEDLTTAKLTITLAIASIRGALGPILGIVQVIKSLLEACLKDQELTDEERKALIDDVQGKTDNLAAEGISYKNEKGTTYTIKVITDPNSPSVAPRRQAIAVDFRGITVLTGPSSFASSTQILIDELKFRIDNQLP